MATTPTAIDHAHVIDYLVMPHVGGTPELITGDLQEARHIASDLPAYLQPARIERICYHCDLRETVDTERS